MKASRFFVGFGPTLWSFTTRRDRVRREGPAVRRVREDRRDDVARASRAAEDERAFYKQPPGRRLVVLCAGSFIHFVIAILLVFGIIAATGVRTRSRTSGRRRPSLRLRNACHCKSGAACAAERPAGACLRQAPRRRPGPGSRTRPRSSNYDELSHQLDVRCTGQLIVLTVMRDGHAVNVHTGDGRGEARRQDGRQDRDLDRVRGNPSASREPSRGRSRTSGQFITTRGTAIGGLPHRGAGILSGKPRDDQGAASIVDVARVSGQISLLRRGVWATIVARCC